ncbi:cytochrome c oxidase assembly protein [Palleronia sp. LCG004]|uniref:cytochrome c oxidase assembly protein n=1 Tax=Palleronia sp. LCG004 TaxID=3079304 RepID=UPI002943858A|nr:cytochrome c oxidase assembly protein [Palleronia sp. LCG004]WOI55267.1 cytochrome c oxidase assembly protein [Palleronia sp. LCG004]
MAWAGIAAALAAMLWALPWNAWIGEFATHMLRHIALVAIVAPVLALAMPERWRGFAPPVLAGAVVEFFVVWGWHLPGPYLASTEAGWIEAAQYLSFLIVGLAVWWGAFAAESPLVGAAGLFLTSMHMTLLGAILIFAGRTICDNGMTLADQHLGAMIMLAVGTPAYLLGGLVLASRVLSLPEERST